MNYDFFGTKMEEFEKRIEKKLKQVFEQISHKISVAEKNIQMVYNQNNKIESNLSKSELEYEKYFSEISNKLIGIESEFQNSIKNNYDQNFDQLPNKIFNIENNIQILMKKNSSIEQIINNFNLDYVKRDFQVVLDGISSNRAISGHFSIYFYFIN